MSIMRMGYWPEKWNDLSPQAQQWLLKNKASGSIDNQTIDESEYQNSEFYVYPNGMPIDRNDPYVQEWLSLGRPQGAYESHLKDNEEDQLMNGPTRTINGTASLLSPEIFRRQNRYQTDPLNRPWEINEFNKNYDWVDQVIKPMAYGAIGATLGAYAGPVLMPLLELYGGYEALNNMFGEHGLGETAQLFKSGDWQNGVWKILGNDIYDAAMAIPGLGRAKQFFGKGIPVELGDNIYRFGFGFRPLPPGYTYMEVPHLWFSKVGNVDLRAKYPNIVRWLEQDMSGKPIAEKTQKIIYDLLENPEKFGMPISELEELEKTFVPGNTTGFNRKKQLLDKIIKIASDLESNKPITAFGKAAQGYDITGEEADYLDWIKKGIPLEPPNFANGAPSKFVYRRELVDWFNEKPLGTVLTTGEWESTDSSLDLLTAMGKLLEEGKVKLIPYNGKMVKTNGHGKRFGQDAVDQFNNKLNWLIEQNPTLDFGDLPAARLIEGNIIEVPQIQVIKTSSVPVRKKGGKLKLIPRYGNKF